MCVEPASGVRGPWPRDSGKRGPRPMMGERDNSIPALAIEKDLTMWQWQRQRQVGQLPYGWGMYALYFSADIRALRWTAPQITAGEVTTESMALKSEGSGEVLYCKGEGPSWGVGGSNSAPSRQVSGGGGDVAAGAVGGQTPRQARQRKDKDVEFERARCPVPGNRAAVFGRNPATTPPVSRSEQGQAKRKCRGDPERDLSARPFETEPAPEKRRPLCSRSCFLESN
ncbi:hypothetical protein H4582DRAFT_2052853 [Lactarius indigo]|nr:hypothetical protein H4582DRAFT_2052853 [Lactarius indigo]